MPAGGGPEGRVALRCVLIGWAEGDGDGAGLSFSGAEQATADTTTSTKPIARGEAPEADGACWSRRMGIPLVRPRLDLNPRIAVHPMPGR